VMYAVLRVPRSDLRGMLPLLLMLALGHTWRPKGTRVGGTMRKWWNSLETGNQIAIIGLIVAILGLLPGYLVFFPTDKQTP
jgi:hypothetical protein